MQTHEHKWNHAGLKCHITFIKKTFIYILINTRRTHFRTFNNESSCDTNRKGIHTIPWQISPSLQCIIWRWLWFCDASHFWIWRRKPLDCESCRYDKRHKDHRDIFRYVDLGTETDNGQPTEQTTQLTTAARVPPKLPLPVPPQNGGSGGKTEWCWSYRVLG